MDSLPDVGCFVEAIAARANDAKSVFARRLHHGPTFHLLDHRGAEIFKATYLGIDIIGLDIDVDSARVLYSLQNDMRIGRIPLHVDITPTGLRTDGFTAQRRAPGYPFRSR